MRLLLAFLARRRPRGDDIAGQIEANPYRRQLDSLRENR